MAREARDKAVNTKVDLSAFDTIKGSEEGKWMEVFAPDGTPIGAKIKLTGKDSKVYRSRVKKLAQKERLKKKMDLTDLENEMLDIHVACTLDWEGIVDNGKELEFNSENVRYVYEKYRWLLDDVVEFVGDREHFLAN